jgi:protease YdgD
MNFSIIILLFAALTFVNSIAIAGAENVFGPTDPRVSVDVTAYPWKAVGRLALPDGSWCTATLVSTDLILTAAHCVMDPEGAGIVKGDYSFMPGYNNGASSDSAKLTWFWWGTATPEVDRQDDWALARLDKALGTEDGWFATNPLDLTQYLNNPMFELGGYNQDLDGGLVDTADEKCSFTKPQNGFFLHNCSDSRGSSGAAIFYMNQSTPVVAAIGVAEYRDNGNNSLVGIPYTDAHANIAVPATKFSAKITELIKNPTP